MEPIIGPDVTDRMILESLKSGKAKTITEMFEKAISPKSAVFLFSQDMVSILRNNKLIAQQGSRGGNEKGRTPQILYVITDAGREKLRQMEEKDRLREIKRQIERARIFQPPVPAR